MILGVLVSCVTGFGLGIALGRFARPLAAFLFVLSFAPMAGLWLYDSYGNPPGETNFGIFAVLFVILVLPAAAATFLGSLFQD